MAKCTTCEKTAHSGSNVSHSHRRGNHIWKANIKSIKVETEGGTRKMYTCISCLRSSLVERV